MTEIHGILDLIFHPKSIALVGITISNPVHWTRTFWNSMREFQFQGQLYPVNPHGGELDGCKVYRSLDEIPGNIDLVISTVSAKVAPNIARQCIRKGVRAVHFCTAGFAETGEEDVTGLQDELTKLARETGIRIIGPNCMGVYCPESRITFSSDFPKESGQVGFISQSGGNTGYVVREAGWRGVRFSKVISFGNACDLNESDFLEYMTEDPQTKIIALYLEGVKDGRRFFHVMEKAAHKKKVVLLKSGLGEAGARAAATHTASMAGSDTAWEALCHQFNLIRPANAEEMVDILSTLCFMPDPGGRNALLIGPGGGASVLLTDEFERQGIRLPPLPERITRQLLKYHNLAGNMLRNPIDFSQNVAEADNLTQAIKLLTKWDEIDFMVGYYRISAAPPMYWISMEHWREKFQPAFSSSLKPTAMILEPVLLPGWQKYVLPMIEGLAEAKMPIYHSFTGAAKALRMVIEHNERHKRLHPG